MAYASRGFGFGIALTPVVKRLLIANVVAFVLTWAIGFDLVFEWLAFHPDRVLTRPWGLVTYMFLHADLWHLAVNMLVLFFFGAPLESRWGGREFLRFYFVAGLGGVLLSFLLAPSILVGASAACYGLMLAFAMNWPDSPIYVYAIFPVKAKWLVAFLFVVSMLSAFSAAGGPVAHFAHLGGFAAAFVYLKADWRTRSALDRLKKAATPRKPRRLAIVPRDDDEDARAESGSSQARRSAWSHVDDRRILDEVDRVLDKISAHGMASLTKEERGLLDEVSRRRRMN